jgi:hypothetical protein
MLYSIYHIRQSCRTDDGKYHAFTFLSNIFTSPSVKFFNNAENEAQRAFEAMKAAEGWSCGSYGAGPGQLIRVDSRITAQQERDAVITYERNGGVGIVEYNYYDGAAGGSAPHQTFDPR